MKAIRHFFMWLLFLLHTGDPKSYRMYLQEARLAEEVGDTPPRSWIDKYRKWYVPRKLKALTGKDESWLNETYKNLCYEDLPEASEVKNVGFVKIIADTVMVDDRKTGYKFTVNCNRGAGQIYVHRWNNDRWNIIYRTGHTIKDVHFISYLSEMENQINEPD